MALSQSWLTLAVLVLTPGLSVCAQEPDEDRPPAPTIKVESKLVAVAAIVRDGAGAPVPDLARENFQLKDNGKSQEITYFSHGSDLPLTMALLVDTSGSQRRYIADEIAASIDFFPAMMTRPEDRAILIQFDAQVRQLMSLTNSVEKLERALPILEMQRGDYARATLLYDGICSVARLKLGTELGRRAMVILTDGEDSGSRATLDDAIREAQRADIMIYSVYYSYPGDGDPKSLKKLSQQTGGRVFSVGPQMTLKQIYVAIGDELRQAYELGYRPPPSKPDQFHKIEVKMTDKKLTVRTREGYMAK